MRGHPIDLTVALREHPRLRHQCQRLDIHGDVVQSVEDEAIVEIAVDQKCRTDAEWQILLEVQGIGLRIVRPAVSLSQALIGSEAMASPMKSAAWYSPSPL